MVFDGPVAAWLTQLLQSEVAKMTLAFMLAARLHRAWVRKDMSEQFSLLRRSIDHVAEVIGKRIDSLDVRIGRIEKKIDPE
jgi:hypothetical protein